MIIFNYCLQVVSFFTGWMINVDEHNCYSHGLLYPLYILIYLAMILMVIIQFLTYGKNYRKQNKRSLYLTMLLVLVGIAFQEVMGGDVRTAYIAYTIGAALMLIHSLEFSQLETDDEIKEKELQIGTDAMTGLGSRHAYEEKIREYLSEMPEDLVVVSIDINELKPTNDNLGHAVGDELICGTAECIQKAFGDHRSCFRIGGDEFVVLACMDRERFDYAMEVFRNLARMWKCEMLCGLSISVGYALHSEHRELNLTELVDLSDQNMYRSKEEYYRATGRVRRGSE